MPPYFFNSRIKTIAPTNTFSIALSPQGARLFITSQLFVVTVHLGMVHSIYDSTTESLIQKTIEGIQGMISIHNKNQGEGEKEKGIRTKEEVIEISLASKRHGELQIRTLQEALRDPDKLRKILNEKQEEYEKADDSEDIERLVPQIEMLKWLGIWSI